MRFHSVLFIEKYILRLNKREIKITEQLLLVYVCGVLFMEVFLNFFGFQTINQKNPQWFVSGVTNLVIDSLKINNGGPQLSGHDAPRRLRVVEENSVVSK